MINFLHTFHPESILISIGFLKIHWYGLFIVGGILAGIAVGLRFASYYSIKKEKAIDLAFWVAIFGIIGARIYHVFLELPYYIEHPLNIFKIWNGGVSVMGGIIAGLLTIYIFSKKNKINFWRLTAIAIIGMPLGQAIGRFGNYFNQELFGLPTDLPWGIPINIMNRPIQYISSEYFHPTFIYESIGSLFIFIILLSLQIYFIKKNKVNNRTAQIMTASYLILYSLLRFSLEFIRIDRTPDVLGLRSPQFTSILIILFCIIFLILPKIKKDVSIK